MMVCFCSYSFAAQNLATFKKRFSFVKNTEGEITYVRMNLVNKKWTIAPYLKQIKQDIQKEIQRMQSKSYQHELDNFINQLADDDNKSVQVAENIGVIRRSLESLEKADIEGIFKQAATKGVLGKFQKELKNALMMLDLSVIASTQDARYFYKRNVTYEVVKRAIDFAKKKFSSVPVLNLVSFVMVRVHDMVLEQRLYHQNMLLHYLQNVKENDLGVTVSEADRIFSSIYESRIGVLSYKESNLAVNTWAKYGLSKFYTMLRTANTKLRRNTRVFDSVGARYDFAFFEAKEDNERVVKNLIHTKHSFSTKMATAYNYDKPDAVRRFRSLLNLGQVGLGFLPIPGWLKGQVDSFIDSYYVEQKLLEGALVAYFDINGNTLMSKNLKAQLINPYIY